MKISEVVDRFPGDVVTVSPSTPAVEAAKLMTENRIGAVGVCDGQDNVVGIMTERDIVWVAANHPDTFPTLSVEDLSSKHMVICSPEDDVVDVVAKMDDARIRHIPVISSGRLIGVLRISDILRAQLSDR